MSLAGPSTLEMPITAEDRITLDVERHTKFSVWVSFCEIYNENIHDLLEPLPIGTPRRTILRLSQDVKGNAFVKGGKTPLLYTQNFSQKVFFFKLGYNFSEMRWPLFFSVCTDLRWVQVNNAEEAFRVMKLGKKNQSFSSTRLNQVSSRRWGAVGSLFSFFVWQCGGTVNSLLQFLTQRKKVFVPTCPQQKW